MSNPTEKKVNTNKSVVTQKNKVARKERVLRRKKTNPNQSVWRIGLAGRLRRLKKKTSTIGADRLKQIQARIQEIEQLFKDHRNVAANA